jgi:hypothetical protein
MKTLVSSSLAGVLLLLGASPALADRFWCGNRLIREEMPVAELKDKCGEPDSLKIVEEPVWATWPNGGVYQVGTVQKQYWVYDRGPQRFPAYLSVEGGIVQEIKLARRLPTDPEMRRRIGLGAYP